MRSSGSPILDSQVIDLWGRSMTWTLRKLGGGHQIPGNSLDLHMNLDSLKSMGPASLHVSVYASNHRKAWRRARNGRRHEMNRHSRRHDLEEEVTATGRWVKAREIFREGAKLLKSGILTGSLYFTTSSSFYLRRTAKGFIRSLPLFKCEGSFAPLWGGGAKRSPSSLIFHLYFAEPKAKEDFANELRRTLPINFVHPDWMFFFEVMIDWSLML